MDTTTAAVSEANTEMIATMAKVLLVLTTFVIIFTILTCIANCILFGKLGKKKWLGVIPVVNDYILYDVFWNRNIFFLYFGINLVMTIISRTVTTVSATMSAFYLVAFIIILFLNISLLTMISAAYGKTGIKNILWSFGLFVLYPVFIIILACKGELTQDAKDKMQKQQEEREQKKAERKVKRK